MQLGGGIGIGSVFEGKKTLGELGLVFSLESLASSVSWTKGVLLALVSVVGIKGMSVWGMSRCGRACSPVALKTRLDPLSEWFSVDPVPSLLEGEGVCQEEGT